ncbi:MAG: hypothetical protein ABI378_08375 [Chitinophagaceae bacterium]
MLKIGSTLKFGLTKNDSIAYLYTKPPWAKGKEKPHELPRSYGNRIMTITDIEKKCFKENCFVAVHLKSDTLDEAVFYIEDAIEDKNKNSGLTIPDFEKYNTCPVKIDKFSIGHNSIGSPIVYVKFTNVGLNKIVGIKFHVYCYDSFGEDVKIGSDEYYEGLYQVPLNPQSTRNTEWTLYLYDRATKFSVGIEQVQYEYDFVQKPWKNLDHILEHELPNDFYD